MAKEDQNTAIHFAEDEQTEKIRHWWKKNGSAIIVGLVLGIGSVAGYQGWGVYQRWQDGRVSGWEGGKERGAPHSFLPHSDE